MSDHKPEKKPQSRQAHGWMAEFDDENKMLEAARRVRDSGYTRTDVFSPFPVHGIDEALGIRPSVLPWFTLVAGATGTALAVIMQGWMNAVDYPYIISGKPFFSLPAFVPVMFELTVLFAAFTTVFAMLGLNGLPRFSNPVFTNPKFDRATDDRFFLWVDSRDKYFNSQQVKSLLDQTGAVAVEEVWEDETSAEIPKGLFAAIATLILITVVPLVVALNIRTVRSGSPRWHVFFDMDFQPFRKAQKETTLFADGRTERPPVPGTVARGDYAIDDPYYLGYTPEPALADQRPSADPAKRLVSLQEGETPAEASQPAESTEPPTSKADSAEPPEEPVPADAGAAAGGAEPDHAWLATLPEFLESDDRLLQLGQQKFNQVCAVCHGFGGYGNGLVSQRAEALGATYWLQPTSVHDPRVQEQPLGRIYFTITHGKGKMGGYGSTLNVRERWAVALYVKALQRSQNAKQSDVPAVAAAK